VNAERLDARSWLLWGFAASLPAILGRNPFPIVASLLAVATVRAVGGDRISSWSGFVRLAVVFSAVGVLFNVLTVRSGNREIAEIPERVPVLDGALTYNALVYGCLSGLALTMLVLIGSTVAASIDWSAALRGMPDQLSTVAVAGSVAFAFIPQTAVAFREIREAQMARGHRFRGVRDLVPLLVPLLTGGLERAVTLSEALESRGFGAPMAASQQRRWVRSGTVVAGLSLLVAAGYLLSVGRVGDAGLIAIGALLAFAIGVRQQRPEIHRTRYREAKLSPSDLLVLIASGLSVLVTIAVLAIDDRAIRYNPYPNLDLPRVSLPLLASYALLLVPAFLTPVSAPEGDEG
jgi:energy-coupling factor transport system permease protein